MPSREYYVERIESEFRAAREARRTGNDGRTRVCARRAAGHAIAWYLSGHPKPGWGTDVLMQLKNLKDDPAFPPICRDAAARLTTKVSDQFSYPFDTDPIDDANIIIHAITEMMESDVA